MFPNNRRRWICHPKTQLVIQPPRVGPASRVAEQTLLCVLAGSTRGTEQPHSLPEGLKEAHSTTPSRHGCLIRFQLVNDTHGCPGDPPVWAVVHPGGVFTRHILSSRILEFKNTLPK